MTGYERLIEIQKKENPIVFNLALNQILNKGRDNYLSVQFVRNEIAKIHDSYKSVKNPIISEEIMVNTIEVAAEIATVSNGEFLMFIRNKTSGNGTDSILKDRLCDLVCGLINDDLEDMTITDVYEKLDRVGFTDNEIDELGYGEVLFGEEADA